MVLVFQNFFLAAFRAQGFPFDSDHSQSANSFSFFQIQNQMSGISEKSYYPKGNETLG